jgi:hypothetical protein
MSDAGAHHDGRNQALFLLKRHQGAGREPERGHRSQLKIPTRIRLGGPGALDLFVDKQKINSKKQTGRLPKNLTNQL